MSVTPLSTQCKYFWNYGIHYIDWVSIQWAKVWNWKAHSCVMLVFKGEILEFWGQLCLFLCKIKNGGKFGSSLIGKYKFVQLCRQGNSNEHRIFICTTLAIFKLWSLGLHYIFQYYIVEWCILFPGAVQLYLVHFSLLWCKLDECMWGTKSILFLGLHP